MDLRQTLSQSQDQSMELEGQLTFVQLPTYTIFRYFREHHPFPGEQLHPDVLNRYIVGVTDSLFDRHFTPTMAIRYAWAIAMIAYGKPVLDLSLSDSIVTNFANAVKKRPYEIDEPFRVCYHPIDDTRHSIDDVVPIALSEKESSIALSNVRQAVQFRHKDRFESLLLSSQEESRAMVCSSYSALAHFRYEALVRVGAPLLHVTRGQNDHRDTLRTLEEKNGTFSIVVPDALFPRNFEDAA